MLSSHLWIWILEISSLLFNRGKSDLNRYSLMKVLKIPSESGILRFSSIHQLVPPPHPDIQYILISMTETRVIVRLKWFHFRGKSLRQQDNNVQPASTGVVLADPASHTGYIVRVFVSYSVWQLISDPALRRYSHSECAQMRGLRNRVCIMVLMRRWILMSRLPFRIDS